MGEEEVGPADRLGSLKWRDGGIDGKNEMEVGIQHMASEGRREMLHT